MGTQCGNLPFQHETKSNKTLDNAAFWGIIKRHSSSSEVVLSRERRAQRGVSRAQAGETSVGDLLVDVAHGD
jgi:hypothetical protein